MSEPDFEPRPLYGIGTVARLTGLKPDTLRVWERRYGLGASHKSASGRRQYTQADLEHLQLVAGLVEGGARIGEIAKAERKTLEMLTRQQGRSAAGSVRQKPRAALVGPGLCGWLDEHQGCLSNVDARLSRAAFADLTDEALAAAGDVDVTVVECPNLTRATVERVASLRERPGSGRLIVCYRFANEHWLRELEAADVVTLTFPPEPGRLAFEIANSAARNDVDVGESNLGDLLAARPRQFSSLELSAARTLKSTLDCECPRHIAELIDALANFEEYSASCSVDNWRDAAVHACIYAYAGQARHLMERAMQAVLEERGEEFRSAVRDLRDGKAAVSDAA